MYKKIKNSNKSFYKFFAFTLAEVVIVIGIIGIVAELTIPTLISDFQKQTTVTELKKQYTSLAQAVKLSESENGNVSTWDWGIANDTASIRKSFDTYWAPYLRISKFCNSYSDCCYEINYYKNLSNVLHPLCIYYPIYRTTVALIDGVILIVSSYKGDGDEHKKIIIDINGAKKPNTSGKDVFFFVLDKDKGLVPEGYNESESTMNNNCNKTSNNYYCATKIMRDGWQIKEDYPW